MATWVGCRSQRVSGAGLGGARVQNYKMSSRSKGKGSCGTPRGELQFDANFESGNLGEVTRLNDAEFDISIRPDTNNPKYRLWFYFRIRNAKAGQRVLFNVVNLCKTRSLYREGMAPCVRTTAQPKWERMPSKSVFYYRSPAHGQSYIMSFVYVFEQAASEHFFAYCFPYTYTDLQRYLYRLERRALPFVQRVEIARTLQHRRLDLLTITAPDEESSGPKLATVFITARVHPGETPASFACQGLIDWLISDDPAAVKLRDRTVFKIVPMLNPDGVFLGNYRCSFVGVDLNRQWQAPGPLAPELVAVKALLQEAAETQPQLAIFIDIHSHSANLSSFMYCNSHDDADRLEAETVLPSLMDARSPHFSFASSKFCRDPNKAGSGRRALSSTEAHCYTYEISNYAALNAGTGTVVPFDVESYTELGRSMGLAFADYYVPTERHK